MPRVIARSTRVRMKVKVRMLLALLNAMNMFLADERTVSKRKLDFNHFFYYQTKCEVANGF